MHPILINLGPFPIRVYGLMFALAFLTAMTLVKRLAVPAHINQEKIQDLVFYSFLVGLLGARTLFVITQLDSFLGDPLSIFKFWEGGFVFLGGPLAVIPFLIWYVQKHQLPTWKIMDLFAPALTIAHALGRLGCLGAGCCYGKPTGNSFGVRLYSDLVEPHLRGILLHPTQLYEAGTLVVLFLGLLYCLKHKTFDGQVALVYLLIYPIIRSVVEIYRGDLVRGFVIEGLLSTSQFLSLLILIGAGFTLMIRLQQLKVKSVHSTG